MSVDEFTEEDIREMDINFLETIFKYGDLKEFGEKINIPLYYIKSNTEYV